MADDEVQEFPTPAGFSDDDIPVIGDHMLQADVEFEAGMSAVPVVGLAIMVACIIAFGFQVDHGGLADLNKLKAMGALDRPLVLEQGQVWRMLSATFLHANFDHILGNIIMLYIMGVGCEHAFGRAQTLTLYVMAGFCGSALSLLDGRVSVGASGAIFGMAGALVAALWWHRRKLHVRDRRIGIILLVWAAYQLFIGWLTPQIDNFAHLGGFVSGCLMGIVFPPAVLQGRAEVGSKISTNVELFLSCSALAATAFFFIPRLVSS